MVPQGQYLNLCSCSFVQHLSLYKNKLLVPQGNQLLRHSWRTLSTLLLWRLHTLVNVFLVYYILYILYYDDTALLLYYYCYINNVRIYIYTFTSVSIRTLVTTFATVPSINNVASVTNVSVTVSLPTHQSLRSNQSPMSLQSLLSLLSRQTLLSNWSLMSLQ